MNKLLLALLLFTQHVFAQCPEDIYGFSTQAEVDNFVKQYPNCNLAYVFIIAGEDITDLSPLSYIPLITHIEFRNLDNISSFDAFENTDIIHSINVNNCHAIDNLEGLNFYSNSNPGWLFVENNNQLSTILHLESSLPMIGNIRIKDNPQLAICNSELVCAALNNPDVEVEISNNLGACFDVSAVEQSCTFGLSDINLQTLIKVFPNPVSEILTIETNNTLNYNSAKVRNALGSVILDTAMTQIDFSNLTSGVYFVEVTTNEGTITKKIIKE